MKSKRTFDRDYDLIKELPRGLHLPLDHEFVQLMGGPPHYEALKRLHIVKDGYLDRLGARCLCDVADALPASRILSLLAGCEYTFCLKCQRAAKAIDEEGDA